jgi:hypothetical protein
MRDRTPGLELDDAVDRVPFGTGSVENMHLASGTHSWNIATEADTGCRQEQGAASAGLGMERQYDSEAAGIRSEIGR